MAYLDELGQIGEGEFAIGTTKVDGSEYVHALTTRIGNDLCYGYEISGAFDLDREYRTFTAIAGVSDDAPSGDPAQFKVTADNGTILKTTTATLGVPVPVRVSVIGVLRLTLSVTIPGNECLFGDHGDIVWADPKVSAS